MSGPQTQVTGLPTPAAGKNDAAFVSATTAPPTLVFKPGAVFPNGGPIQQNVYTTGNASGADGLALLQDTIAGEGLFPVIPMPSCVIELDVTDSMFVGVFIATTPLDFGRSFSLRAAANQEVPILFELSTGATLATAPTELTDINLYLADGVVTTFPVQMDLRGSAVFGIGSSVALSGINPTFNLHDKSSLSNDLSGAGFLFDGSCTLVINMYDGSSLTSTLFDTFTSGSCVINVYSSGASGWQQYVGAPNITVNNLTTIPGRWLSRQVIQTGPTTFTTSSQTNEVLVRMVGGGGQGGGSATTAGFCGSGGGAGAYSELRSGAAPSTAYTIAVGVGGTTGGAGAPGQNGTATSITIGVTKSANGRSGGKVGTAVAVPVLGGLGGTQSAVTSQFLTSAGEAGAPSVAGAAAADTASGAGGNSIYGAGAQGLLEATGATGNSAATLGFGGGGGGATSTGTARAGGAGANGVMIIDEYS